MKAFLPLIALFCTGCSTLLTMNSGVPYSGVQCNIEGMRKTFDTSTPYYLMPHWAEGIFSTIDLPLSVVGDTIILPYVFLNKGRPYGVEAHGSALKARPIPALANGQGTPSNKRPRANGQIHPCLDPDP